MEVIIINKEDIPRDLIALCPFCGHEEPYICQNEGLCPVWVQCGYCEARGPMAGVGSIEKTDAPTTLTKDVLSAIVLWNKGCKEVEK